MSEKNNYLILPAADTAKRWEETLCVPAYRELIVIYDDNDENNIGFKVGDGVTPLKDLEYVTQIKDLLPYIHTYVTHKTRETRVTLMMNPKFYHKYKLERATSETKLEDKT